MAWVGSQVGLSVLWGGNSTSEERENKTLYYRKGDRSGSPDSQFSTDLGSAVSPLLQGSNPHLRCSPALPSSAGAAPGLWCPVTRGEAGPEAGRGRPHSRCSGRP